MWSLELQDREPFLIRGKDQQEIFENETGVTLKLTNTDCDDDVVEYSLSIWKITRNMEGLIVRCGTFYNDSRDVWYAPHFIRLKIGMFLQRIQQKYNKMIYP